MRTDYFDDLLPDSVTGVTRQKTVLVTHEKENAARKTAAYASVTTVTSVTAKKGNTGVNEAPRTLRVFQYRLTDNPAAWLVMIAPGCDRDEALECLRRRFGKRLIDVTEYKPGNVKRGD